MYRLKPPVTLPASVQPDAAPHQQDSRQGSAQAGEPGSKARVYRVEEIAEILSISLRAAYNLCNTTTAFKVLHIGASIRVSKASFDAWFARSEQ